MANRIKLSSEEKADYDVIYEKLEEEHKVLTGDYFRIERISDYTVFKNADEILFAVKMSGAKVPDLVKHYKVTKTAIDKLLKSN